MKHLKFLFAMAFLFIGLSCFAQDPTDKIGLAGGFKYCVTLGGYWAWIIIALIVNIIGGYLLYKSYQNNGGSAGMAVIAFILLAFLLGTIFYLPGEIGNNTNFEQAARGAFIGR